MHSKCKSNTFLVTACLGMIFAHNAYAEAPNVETKGTLIYLADNLNGEDKLGWCIDTVGRGLSDQLHAHTCKPNGGDVQFGFDPASGQIESVAYADKCMALSAPEDAEKPFGLLDCDSTAANQKFAYDMSSMEIRIASDETKCVTVAPTIIEAGPSYFRRIGKNKHWVD